MKKIMEMLQNMKAKNEKKDNKGFSLVELIIVIAIMAILVGIVGTQVIPYINRSREAKDQQIISAYSTAAVSAYSMLAGEIATTPATVTVYASNSDTDAQKIADKIKELTYGSLPTFSSTEGKKISEITITIDSTNHKITASGTGSTLTVSSDF